MTTATEHQAEDVKPDAIGVETLTYVRDSSDPIGGFYPDPRKLDTVSIKNGDKLVRYEDHLRAVLNPMGHKLSRDMDSLYSVLQFILDNIADLEQSPEFAGFQAHRILNDEGNLLQITLTPCDKIDDITAPRMVNAEAPKVKAVKKPGLKLVDAKGGAL